MFDHLLNAGLKWEARCAAAPNTRIDITGVRVQKHLDLALVTLAEDRFLAFPPASEDPIAGDGIRAIGFPMWNTPADGMAVLDGRVSQVRVVSAATGISTNVPFRQGISGGPILREDGHVIGVALRDHLSALTPNGGNHIKHIKDVLTCPMHKL